MSLKGRYSRCKFSCDADKTVSDAEQPAGCVDVGRTEQTRTGGMPAFVPFPTKELPAVLSAYVESTADAIGCDQSFVALPLLSVLASAVGNSRRLQVKRGWLVPPIIWAAIIGESGAQKSPPLRVVTKVIERRQRLQFEEYQHQMLEHQSKLADHKKELNRSDRSKNQSARKPRVEPVCARCLVSDTTVEGLVPILQENWRGVLLKRDELVGWIGGFDKYSRSGSVSADAAHWLSVYNADSIVVDRKTGFPRMLIVPEPCVSVIGSIQPSVLNNVLSTKHRENGLAARLLMTYPPRKAKRWVDVEMPATEQENLERLVDGLFALEPALDSQRRPVPKVVGLTDEARSRFIEHYNATSEELSMMHGELAASWAKLEETVARIALVVHCVRVVSEHADELECDIVSMRTAVTLVEWFKHETYRIQLLLSETPEERKKRQLTSWISGRGGTMRARDLVRNRRDIQTAAEAERQMQELVNEGVGCWRHVPSSNTGGRPTREFVLFPRSG